MTQEKNLEPRPLHPAPMGNRMLQGAAIALLLITAFLLSVDNAKPEWGKLWMIKPLVVVTAAGSMGGVFYFFMDHLRYEGGWKKVMANVTSLIVFIFILWISSVLGLDGTLWD